MLRDRDLTFGPHVEQSVLYLLTKESLKKNVLEKSISENGEGHGEVI
jgi:hypothetical protein